ncbi:unnamed protein product [Rotaria socialis]
MRLEIFDGMIMDSNSQGIEAMCLFQNQNRQTDPYVAPFTSDHLRHIFANIIKTSLECATRYSSTFEEFNNERRNIKLMLLYNQYPLTFIENEFQKYFSEYISISPFLHFIDGETKYIYRRERVLGQSTFRQSQVAISVAQANVDNEEVDDPLNQPNGSTKQTEEKTLNFHEKLFIHFTHEKRFQPYRQDMHQI